MAKLTLDNIGNFTSGTVTTINTNFDRIEAALEKTLSRDGTVPNQMEADLDMNNQDLLNVGEMEISVLDVGALEINDVPLEDVIREIIEDTEVTTTVLPTVANSYLRRNAGNTAFSAVTADQVRADLGSGIYVADRTDLKALVTSNDTRVFLEEVGRQGIFIWDGDNHAADVTADVAEGVFIPSGADPTGAAGAWVRVFSDELRPEWFGGIGDGSVLPAAMYTALSNLNTMMLYLTRPARFVPGEYTINDNHMPFRNPLTTSLLDYAGCYLLCDGPGVIFKTVTSDGADVFQLQAVQNLSIYGFPTVTCEHLTLAGSGSNGISITSGGDNIYIEANCVDLPGIDNGIIIDGGNAFTIQPSTTTNEVGRIKAIIYAKNCTRGFDFSPVPETMDDKRCSIDVEVYAENCYEGFRCSASAPAGAFSDNHGDNVSVRLKAVNCQRAIHISRGFSLKIDADLKTSTTAAARRLSPVTGLPWFSGDTIVEGAKILMARHCDVKLLGSAGECDYKIQVGAASPGGSGLTGNTQYCKLFFDVGGTAGTADVNAVLASGVTLANNEIWITPRTATRVNIPSAFKETARFNNLHTFDGWEMGKIFTLTDAATITPDFDDALNFTVTLAGNRTMANPTSIADYIGRSGIITIRQDAVGSRTLAWGTQYQFPAGTDPTLTVTASGRDQVKYYIASATEIWCVWTGAHA